MRVSPLLPQSRSPVLTQSQSVWMCRPMPKAESAQDDEHATTAEIQFDNIDWPGMRRDRAIDISFPYEGDDNTFQGKDNGMAMHHGR